VSLRLTLAVCLIALCTLAGAACGGSSPPAAQRSASALAPAPSAAVPAPTDRALGAAPSRAEVVQAVGSLVARRDPGITVEKVVDIEIARAAYDRWWVRADALPAPANDVETPTVVAVERSGHWKLAGYGTDLESDAALRRMHVPSAVARQLFPDTGLWAGYRVTGSHLRSVSATWVEPNATVRGTNFRSASFWVGLGGNGDGLTQIGTSADTQGGSVEAFYAYAWYEMYPKPPVTDLWVHNAAGRQRFSMGPGDTITASVVFLGGQQFRLSLADKTQGERFTTVQRRADPGFRSAEIIVEGYWHRGHDLLAAFQPVRFRDCRVNGRPLGARRPGKTEIVFGPSGHYLTSTSQLSANGTSFSVTRQ
ncbi:MAG TPA: G1 family glutamic endopeptidase, partial [Thermoleophilia bacterium]|nr:G1 family glutamic endopeptidase [Thermoleophilia bacterium]